VAIGGSLHVKLAPAGGLLVRLSPLDRN
jgi:hypothetical protein